MLPKLYYISQATTPAGHLEAIESTCEAGIQLVQLRIKQSTPEEVLPIAVEARTICNRFSAKLFINDYPEIAIEVGADGIHLGKEDMTPGEARNFISKEMLIGGTANSFEDIVNLSREGVDYIGLGPYRFTTTKAEAKLAPILGVEGLSQIMHQCNLAGIQVPVFAIGGILPGDVKDILQTHAFGIAVSGVIAHSTAKKEIIKELNELLYEKAEDRR